GGGGGRRGEGKEGGKKGEAAPGAGAPGGPRDGREKDKEADGDNKKDNSKPGEARGDDDGGMPGGAPPTVRKNFADTALWKGVLKPNKDGIAEVTFTLPEQTTGWKVRVWAMGHGTKVGQGEAEITTKKDLLLRLQAPRFFVQKDE